MSDWTKTFVAPEASIRETIAIIDAGSLQIALVVNATRQLLGTVTDGDIRRGILRGHGLDAPVAGIMNTTPTVARLNESREDILVLMKQKQIHQIPLLDEQNVVVGIESIDAMLQSGPRNNPVVIMAGGLGSRLHPLTDDCPKPLLRIGNKPILETILENFTAYGFEQFYFSVNYRADMVQEYFGNGERWGVRIEYLHEDRRLGTAGALSLLPAGIREPILVMNGDLLTKVNFEHLLNFHARAKGAATMCVREFQHTVPYGVLTLDEHRIAAIEEKPVQRYFVNAGIYVLDPECLAHIPASGVLDMPELFCQVIATGAHAAAFPIREYWIDIGRLDDYERANGEYSEIFG